MHVSELFEPEALPDPNEAAREALGEVAHFFEPDIETIFTRIEARGLTFCWKVNP
jgi:hypothetical protein